MAELFPTPASAVNAMTDSGWVVTTAEDLLDIDDPTIVACLQRVQLDDGTVACTPTVVDVHRDGDKWRLTGRTTGREVTEWAATNPREIDSAKREPLLLYIIGRMQVLDECDPRAQDRVHDGMPADPFGETPASAAHATDAIELFAIMGTYEAAGFTREEAFKLVESIHQVELDHAAQHCLVHHQQQYEQGGDQ